MVDQATQLRNLVLRCSREAAASHAPPPRLLVIGGGRSGVGVTTLAVNLSVGLSNHGARVVLVDADLYRADVAARCGLLHAPGDVADVLAARCDIHEVLRQGPGGVQVAPGAGVPAMSTDYSRSGHERLLRQLRTLGRHADVVVLETGNSSSEVVRRFWLAADEILIVTTPEPVAVMDCYTAMKRLAASGGELPIRLIVNKSVDGNTAEDVHRRINTSCQRFLGMELGLLGHVPPHARFESSPDESLSIASSSPMDGRPASLEAMIVQLMDRVGEPTRGAECADQPRTNVNKQVDSAQPRSAHWPIVR